MHRTRRRTLAAALLLAPLLAANAMRCGPPAPATTVAVASGLASPLFAAAPEGDDRLFILERIGRIRVWKAGAVLGTPFLNLTGRVGNAGEGGLLGLAFPPDHASSGLFYVYFTDTAGDAVLSRFQVGANPDVADPTEALLLVLPQPCTNHHGGSGAFRPTDGMLYLAPGDGGSSNDPAENAQDLSTLLGKMLRIDVSGGFGSGYTVPADNPFVGVAGARPEIWALGLRNPYRFSFDRWTGDAWIADVGQGAREEVDVEPAGDPGGRNWGWDVMEGSLCNPNDPAPAPPCNDPALSLPELEYAHAAGRCSITGGMVVRAPVAGLFGLYLYGDFCTGEVWAYDRATGLSRPLTAELFPGGAPALDLVGFAEDGALRPHLVLRSGSVLRIEVPVP